MAKHSEPITGRPPRKSRTMNGGSDSPLEKAEATRQKMLSAPGVEDTGRFEVPSDAPARLRWSLAALFSLPPGGRTAVLLLTVVCLTALVWRFGPAVVSLFYKL